MAASLFRFPGATIAADVGQSVAVRAPDGRFYRVTVQDIIDLAVAGGVSLPSINDDGTTVTIDARLTVTGSIIASGLPVSDPASAGMLWSNAGVVTVSAG